MSAVLSVLAVNCFMKVNLKVYIDDVEYACIGVEAPQPSRSYL